MTSSVPDGATPTVTTPAQARVVADVLGWGQPRPRAPEALAAHLHARLEDGLAAIGPPLRRLAQARRGGRIVVSRTLLQRAVCQGWQLAPEPYVHTTANARGVMGRAAILADLGEGRQQDPAAVVARCWRRLASDRPGDPRSLAAWMNRVTATERTTLQSEVTDLVVAVREVWPTLPVDRVELALDTSYRVGLAAGVVVLAGTVDLAVDSRVDDGRARRLIVDLRTGQARAPLDRLGLRFAALLATLTGHGPPFRWSTFYVAEGRFVSEDLDRSRGHEAADDLLDGALDGALEGMVDRIVNVVTDLVALEHLAPDAPESDLRLAAGVWCGSCRRRADCSVAAAAGRGPWPAGS